MNLEQAWRTATILLLVLAVAAFAWGYGQMQAKEAVQNSLDARYQQAFFDAVDRVENVEALLAKALVTTAPEQVAVIFSDLWAQAWAAQANLTQLPLQQGTLMRTSKFLTQVGDFGYSVAKRAASGSPPDAEAQNLMRRMMQEASVLSSALSEIQKASAEGSMPWREIERQARATLGSDSQATGESEFARLERHFEGLPVIQYDGPFSDHILQRSPKGLTGPEITASQAEEAALRFVPLTDKEQYEAEVVRRVEGEIEAFGLEVRRRDEADPIFIMDVTKKGGHVVWMLDRESSDETRISVEEAVRSARSFLDARGFGSMTPTYATVHDHRTVIPFVPEQDGVLIYPDLIKVTVSLETGSVVGFEALGYLMSHTERDLPEPKISADQARERLPRELRVEGEGRLALIPLETLEEVLTWEFSTSMDGERYLIYVNVENGREERILRIVDTEEGPKTM